MPRRQLSREEMVCPVCLVVFPAGKVNLRFLSCPHCESEAITVDRELISKYLERVSLANLELIAKDWEKEQGFLATYKAQKRSRIKALIKHQKSRSS